MKKTLLLALTFLSCLVMAQNNSKLMNKLFTQKISVEPHVENLDNLLSSLHQDMPIPVCQERFTSESAESKMKLADQKFSTYGDLFRHLERNGFVAKETCGVIVIESPAVAAAKKMPLDAPSPKLSFHGNFKGFLDAIGGQLLASGLTLPLQKGQAEEACDVQFSMPGSLRDLLATFASQNNWYWNVGYDAESNKPQRKNATGLALSKGVINFYKKTSSVDATK